MKRVFSHSLYPLQTFRFDPLRTLFTRRRFRLSSLQFVPTVATGDMSALLPLLVVSPVLWRRAYAERWWLFVAGADQSRKKDDQRALHLVNLPSQRRATNVCFPPNSDIEARRQCAAIIVLFEMVAAVIGVLV